MFLLSSNCVLTVVKYTDMLCCYDLDRTKCFTDVDAKMKQSASHPTLRPVFNIARINRYSEINIAARRTVYLSRRALFRRRKSQHGAVIGNY